MKNKIKNIRWIKKVKNEKFENLDFEGLNVFSKKIENCQFLNVHFKHSSLGSRTTYEECIFENCIFIGQYTSLGNPTDYIDCKFIIDYLMLSVKSPGTANIFNFLIVDHKTYCNCES